MIKVDEIEPDERVEQCHHCKAVLTYKIEDTVIEWDRGVDYRMLKCPVCNRRMEV